MVNFYPYFVNCSPNATLSQVAGECCHALRAIYEKPYPKSHLAINVVNNCL